MGIAEAQAARISRAMIIPHHTAAMTAAVAMEEETVAAETK